jgi:uncharacterized repeat protein (TIGR03803 family)
MIRTRKGIMMQSDASGRRPALLARGFAALCAGLTVGASAGAWADTTETVLYAFTGGADGGQPDSGLIADNKGNLYGTTTCGGASSPGASAAGCPSGFGTVFVLSPPATAEGAWNLTVLYAFTGGNDGANPEAGLIIDGKGNLYGTTYCGGTSGSSVTHSVIPCLSGNGTAFKLTPPAAAGGPWTETVLYAFTGGTDGARPLAGLIADSDGNLYGTTTCGGTPVPVEASYRSSGNGTVFKLTPPAAAGGPWTETVLYAFAGGTDGAYPFAGVMIDNNGNLYGTTLCGGVSGNGSEDCPSGFGNPCPQNSRIQRAPPHGGRHRPKVQ